MIFFFARKHLQCLVVMSVLWMAGCVPRHNSSSSRRVIAPADFSMYIAMPKNVIAFEHIAPLIYEALYDQYEAAGYDVRTSRSKSDFVLTTRVVHFDRPDQFVSPDLIPYVFRVRLELECELHKDGVVLQRKRFVFARWVQRPDDPVLNDSFLTYQYKELLRHSMPRIDYYFRTVIAKQRSDTL